MRFTVTACIRGSFYETDEFQTNNIRAAMRVFDSFTIAAQSVSIYDHVQLWETVGSEDIIVEDRRAPHF